MRVPKQITSRLDGTYLKEIKRIGDAVKILQIEKEREVSGAEDFLEKYIKCLQMRRRLFVAEFFLSRLLPQGYRDDFYKAVNELVAFYFEADRININGIYLPLPKERECHVFCAIILETLIQEVLVSIDSDKRFFLSTRPYEYENLVCLEKGDIVIDAGANIGDFSALAVHKGCSAYAFEPMEFIINDYLSKTIELNPNIILAPFALYDKEETLVFNIDNNNIGGASSERKSLKHKEIATAKAIPLDVYVDRNNLPRVDFIKADIEGAERKMLMGARGVLKDFAPKLALCTYHLPDDPEVMKDIILSTNPNYKIIQDVDKMYCYV